MVVNQQHCPCPNCPAGGARRSRRFNAQPPERCRNNLGPQDCSVSLLSGALRTPHSALRIGMIARGKPVTRLHCCPSTTYPVTSRLHPSYTVTSLSISNLTQPTASQPAIFSSKNPNCENIFNKVN